jgi:HlyD family secretion protein
MIFERDDNVSGSVATEPLSGSLAGSLASSLPADPGRTASSRGADLKAKVQSLRLAEVKQRPVPSRLPWALTLLLAASTAYFAFKAQQPAARPAVTTPAGASDPAVASTASASGSTGKPGDTAATTATGSTPTDAAPVDPSKIALESKGYIIPAHQILVSPKVSGMLTALNIEEGRRVEKGEILAQIETIEYDADLARVRANLALAKARLAELENGNRSEEKDQARAELAEAEHNLEQAQADWDRAKKLRASKTISIDEYEQSETQWQITEQRVTRLRFALELMLKGAREERIEQARAEVAQVEADLKKAVWRQDNTTVRAPISGTILKKNAEEGNIVNPVAFNGSFSLCDMADLAQLEVDLSINERDISRVFKQQRCEIVADAWPSRKYQGYVDRLMPIADRAKGSVSVRVKLIVPAEEEGVYLKPDMAALVRFYGDKTPLETAAK